MNAHKTIWNALSLTSISLLLGLSGLPQSQAIQMNYAQTTDFKYLNRFIKILTKDHLEEITQSVTVKVIADPIDWGSGVIVSVKDQTYTVITNDHVIRSEQNITVVTPDQVKHKATLLETLRPKGIDIAIVQFQSKNNYNTVAIGSYQSLAEGDFTFASGFPLEIANSNRPYGFKITSGNISLKLDKPLTQAYQLGYTNNIERGMSGGPVLDIYGRLVAINGRGNSALVPQRFQDRTMPCPPLRKIIGSSSWSVPINIAISQSQKLANLNYSLSEKSFIVGKPSVLDKDNIDYVFPYTINLQIDKSLKVKASLAKQCKPNS